MKCERKVKGKRLTEGVEGKIIWKKKKVPDGERRNVLEGVGNQSESERKNVPVDVERKVNGKTYWWVLMEKLKEKRKRTGR